MKAPYLLALCLSGVIVLAASYPSQGGESLLLGMDVRVHPAHPGQLEMDVVLTNISKQPIRLY